MNRNAIILPFLTAAVLFAGNISSKPGTTTSSSRETAVEQQEVVPVDVELTNRIRMEKQSRTQAFQEQIRNRKKQQHDQRKFQKKLSEMPDLKTQVKRAFASKKQNSIMPHGNDMSSYPTGYSTHQTENNGRPTVQNIRNRETISFFDYHDVHNNVSSWLTTNATFAVETDAGPESGEDALKWIEGDDATASRSKVGWSFNPNIDLSGVWDSVSVSDHWFRIEIKTDYSGDLKVYFSDGPGKYQLLTVTVQGTGLWETYEFPLSDTSPTTGANATDFNTSDIDALSIQDFNHQEGRTFYIGVIEIYSPADDENGVIEGMVFDNYGYPLSGASVTAYNANESISVMTNETGYYNMSVADSSTYRVYASYTGYWDADHYPVVASVQTVVLDFTLMPDTDYAWIIGEVQDDMGNIVSEAVVTITGLDGVDVFSQPSDWSGSFYAVVAPGTYNIHADSVAFEGELLSGEITLEAEAGMIYYPVVELNSLDDLDLTIELNGEQTATVEAGDSLQVTITFDTAGETAYIGSLSVHLDADADGMLSEADFNLMGNEDGEGFIYIMDNDTTDENPAEGIYQITLHASQDNDDGFPPLTYQNSSWLFAIWDPDTTAPGYIATLNVTGFESGYSISGAVSPAMANLLVIAWQFDYYYYDYTQYIAMTGADGSYSISTTGSGQYDVYLWDGFEILPSNYYLSNQYQYVNVNGHITDVDFEMIELNTMVYGYVVDDNGDPVDSASVYFSSYDYYYYYYYEYDYYHFGTHTDTNGYYELYVLGGLEYDVSVYGNDYLYNLGFNGTVTVPDGEEFFEYNIQLINYDNSVSFNGYVLSNDEYYYYYYYPEAIAGAVVKIYNNDEYHETTTNESGYYSITVPHHEYYSVYAEAEGFEGYTVDFFDLQPGSWNYADFYLNPEVPTTLVSGMVMGEDGERIANAAVTAYDGNGGQYWAWTTDLGMYELELDTGIYDIRASAIGYLISWEYEVEVADQDITLNYTLSTAVFTGSVSGMVHFHGGDVEDMVYIEVGNDNYSTNTYANNDGSYYLDLVDGTYHVFAYAAGYEPLLIWEAFTVAGNSVPFDIHLFVPGFTLPPHIEFLGDVPNDQGRQMRVVWSPGIPGDWQYFTQYSVWRLVPEAAPGILWDYVVTVPWHGMQPYSTVVPTLGDSTDQGIYYSTFMVTAHTEDPNFFLDSNPATGYSVDNIHPGAPGGVMAVQTGAGVHITWHHSVDEDFNHYLIYRNDIDTAGEAEAYTTVDTFFVDAGTTDGNWEYWITAMDNNGNESEPSEVVTLLLAADKDWTLPMEFALQQNYPNPFNPSTQIRYALPEAAMVTIAIYDMMGRKVRTLIHEQSSAGYHALLWNATNDLGDPVSAGVYVYTFETAEFRDARKMILLK